MKGGNKPIASPFYNTFGALKLYKAVGKKLVYSSEVSTGVWTQGIAFTPDSKTMLVQNKEEKELQVLAIRNGKAVDTKQRIATKNGGSGIGTRSICSDPARGSKHTSRAYGGASRGLAGARHFCVSRETASHSRARPARSVRRLFDGRGYNRAPRSAAILSPQPWPPPSPTPTRIPTT